jgi:formylglycine-generating enzyme required for sulfatase activity
MKNVLLSLIIAVSTVFAPALCQAAEMILVKGGQFTMGSPTGESSRGKDEVQHRVTLSDFYLGKFAVTQQEFEEVMDSNPSHFQGQDLPMENVTWFEAVSFCNELSKLEGFIPAYSITGSGENISVTWNHAANGYRLPTEAEWEYACRAGTTTPFHTGANITPDQANYYGTYPYNDAPSGRYRESTVPVGRMSPNAWGLHEMHGNVWEWCWDWYGEYSPGAQTNPAGSDTGTFRINRGGGWNDFGRHLRSAYRAAHNPENRTFNIGFRLVRNAE